LIGGLGVQELLVVLVIALFVFGGKRLPEVGQNLGKALRGFKDGTEGKVDEEEKAIDEDSGSKSESSEADENEEETEEIPASEEIKEPGVRSPEPEGKNSRSG
jgi:sec-independent protein translocase protein TatA